VDSEPFLDRLCEIPGIGKWTAQYIAMRALGEPDAFPSTDLGLLHAMAVDSARELEERAEAWRPWRAYAAMYLWKMASERRVRESKIPDKDFSKVGKVSAEVGTCDQLAPVVLPNPE
jgi:3-methyladenine DNA glycosylase/8-oxoguanine DNA glycosylase